VESLHVGQQLARVAVDGDVDLGPAGRMGRRIEHPAPEALPLRAVQVRDNDGEGLPLCVLDLRCGTVVRFEVRHDPGRLVVLAVHLPGGSTMGDSEEAIVRKMRIAYEGRPARDPTQQHAGDGVRQVRVTVGGISFVVGQAQDQTGRRIEHFDDRPSHAVGKAEVRRARFAHELFADPQGQE